MIKDIIKEINDYTSGALENYSFRLQNKDKSFMTRNIGMTRDIGFNRGGRPNMNLKFIPKKRNNQELNFILELYKMSNINELINIIYEKIDSCKLHHNIVLDIYINFLNFIKIYCNLQQYEKIYLLILTKEEFENIFIDILYYNNSFIYLKKILCDSIFNIYPMISNKNINYILIYNLILINNIIKLYKFIKNMSFNFGTDEVKP